MKVVGKLQILKQPTTTVEIDSSITATARIKPSTTLDAVVLLPCASPLKQSGGGEIRLPSPKVTVIATTLPESSWARLIRISVTLDPKPGSLRKLLSALRGIGLRCRYVETINDIDMKDRRVVAPDLQIYSLEQDYNAERPDLIIPSTLLVLEVPDEATTRRSSTAADEREIHKELRRLVGPKPTRTQKAKTLLQAYLRNHLNSAEVDWISPMATLNRLALRLGSSQRKEYGGRLSQRILITGEKHDSLHVDFSSLRHILWDMSAPSSSYWPIRNRPSVFVKAFVDSDEKIICWDFYQFDNDLVVQFGLTTPSGGREHFWWEWTYQCLEEARGNILASSNWARIDGGWTTVETTVIFPLREDNSAGAEDMRTIVNCFRKLQGDRGYTEHFEVFKSKYVRETTIPQDSTSIEDNLDSDAPRSILRQVEVSDPHSSAPTTRVFSDLFASNPYHFTRPLDLELYNTLYDEVSEPSKSDKNAADRHTGDRELISKSRRRLAMRIIEKLLGEAGENIAIVGAHRTGKTTVLNLVYDILLKEENQRQNLVVPVRINASLDPPQLFIFAVMKELFGLANDKTGASSELLAKAATFILNQLAELEVNLDPIHSSLSLGLRAFFEPAKRLVGKINGQSKPQSTQKEFGQLQEAYKQLENQGQEAILPFLRSSLELFRKAVPDNQRLLIIVDEFSESSSWGSDKALPLWRHVMESKDFSEVKWLISTSRPVQETSKYSPITNVLHEFNVGPLPQEESDRLIDAFSVRAWKKSMLPLDAGSGHDTSLLYPVVMAQARVFLLEITSRLPYLLQVVCYHVYDRAIRTYVPLISRSLCIEIVCDFVLPELSDYLEYQLSHIDEETKAVVSSSVAQFKNQGQFLKNLHLWKCDFRELSPGNRKNLERSGLRGDDSHCLAPIVACWFLPPWPLE